MTRDLRKFFRLPVSTLAHLAWDGRTWVGVLTDISPTGLCCRRFESHEVGALEGSGELAIDFVLPTGMVHATVSVVWIDRDLHEVGLTFVALDAAARSKVASYCDSGM